MESISNMSKRLGIIQSRGLGDLVIALPIAHHYHKEGWEIYWPILEEFMPSMQGAAPWVKWIPLPYDSPGRYFYDVPLERLKNFKCDETLCLYQALTGHQEFSDEVYFAHTKFDQYKYIKAGVPFTDKWKLGECITRNKEREEALYDKLVVNPHYVAVHLEGSDHKATFDRSIIPADWDIIEISKQTDNVFDWLMILEKAQSLVLVDSIFANLVDQLSIGDDRHFIPRSHIGLTPVQGNHWNWLQRG
jgi:hypothetical protein